MEVFLRREETGVVIPYLAAPTDTVDALLTASGRVHDLCVLKVWDGTRWHLYQESESDTPLQDVPLSSGDTALVALSSQGVVSRLRAGNGSLQDYPGWHALPEVVSAAAESLHLLPLEAHARAVAAITHNALCPDPLRLTLAADELHDSTLRCLRDAISGAEGAKEGPPLKALDLTLYYTQIDERTLSGLLGSGGVCQLESLRLNLCFNGLHDAACEVLLPLVVQENSLSELRLDLSRNSITDSGASLLCQGLCSPNAPDAVLLDLSAQLGDDTTSQPHHPGSPPHPGVTDATLFCLSSAATTELPNHLTLILSDCSGVHSQGAGALLSMVGTPEFATSFHLAVDGCAGVGDSALEGLCGALREGLPCGGQALSLDVSRTEVSGRGVVSLLDAAAASHRAAAGPGVPKQPPHPHHPHPHHPAAAAGLDASSRSCSGDSSEAEVDVEMEEAGHPLACFELVAHRLMLGDDVAYAAARLLRGVAAGCPAAQRTAGGGHGGVSACGLPRRVVLRLGANRITDAGAEALFAAFKEAALSTRSDALEVEVDITRCWVSRTTQERLAAARKKMPRESHVNASASFSL